VSTLKSGLLSSQAPPRASSRAPAGALERERLLERLAHLRAILPSLAEELAAARRQSAALRVENRGLLEEVRRLRHQRGDSSPTRSTGPAHRSTKGGN
jgi:hypothetical protein